MAGQFLASLGKDRLLVGVRTNDNAAAGRAPFSLRYLYLAGGVFDGNAPCASCTTNCTPNWWGCWQDTSQPPGKYLRDFIANAKARAQLPMISYYQLFSFAGVDGTEEVAKLTDVSVTTRFFGDFRFLLQQVGQDRAIVHVEPDFWGYAQQVNSNPNSIAAAVATGNPTDCASQPNTLPGFSRCLVSMARKYAPNAKVGFHASAWATGPDVSITKDTSVDVQAEATKQGNFLKECAPDADFIAVEASDRDAAWYQATRNSNRWWDATNATIPNFHRAFAWTKKLAETAGKPVLWWQLPVGNMSLNNTADHWQDNRVDYFFAHPDEVAKAHGVGMAFGPGTGGQTRLETDGDNLINRVKAYAASGGQAPCP
jgi:hypothetical protein